MRVLSWQNQGLAYVHAHLSQTALCLSVRCWLTCWDRPISYHHLACYLKSPLMAFWQCPRFRNKLLVQEQALPPTTRRGSMKIAWILAASVGCLKQQLWEIACGFIQDHKGPPKAGSLRRSPSCASRCDKGRVNRWAKTSRYTLWCYLFEVKLKYITG